MNLDKNQESAVYAKDENTLIVAAPGAGKTTVIINRVRYLVEEKGVDERNIVVLTFTKNAAMDMKKRYTELVKTDKSPFFGTFHGLFYRILNKRKKINIIPGTFIFNIVGKALKEKMSEVSDDTIKEYVSAISYYRNKGKACASDLSINVETLEHVIEKYNEFKESRDFMDFDDLQKEAVELFLQDNRAKEFYQNTLKYILVDEFQDCDENQIEFLQIINNKENSIYAVGDEDQCIYSFRGANPTPMIRFKDYFGTDNLIYLDTNYRSKKDIVDKSLKLITNNKNRNNKNIRSFANENGFIDHIVVNQEELQGRDIAEKIKDIFNKTDDEYSDFAILYRTNDESNAVINALITDNIPFRFQDKEYNFFNNNICKDLTSYLKLAINRNDKESFSRIINKPFRYISRSALEKFKAHGSDEPCFSLFLRINDIPPYQEKRLAQLDDDIRYLNKITLNHAIATIINEIGYMDYLNEFSEKYKGSIDDSLEIVRQYEEMAKSHKSIASFLTYIENYSERLTENKNERDAVILSTIHGVKGMEFKNVFIINVNEGIIPHSNNSNLEEERRLFYVGMTRAINNLYIYTSKVAKGKFMDPSLFLGEIGFVNSLQENKDADNKNSNTDNKSSNIVIKITD